MPKNRIHVLSEDELQKMLSQQSGERHIVLRHLQLLQGERPIWGCDTHNPPHFVPAERYPDGTYPIRNNCLCLSNQRQAYRWMAHLNCENILYKRLHELEENERRGTEPVHPLSAYSLSPVGSVRMGELVQTPPHWETVVNVSPRHTMPVSISVSDDLTVQYDRFFRRTR